MSYNSRFFHGEDLPILRLYTPTVRDGVPGHFRVSYTLECPVDRTLKMNRQSVSSRAMKAGKITNWIQHIWMSGSFTWSHLSWDDAQALIEAFTFETSDSGVDRGGSYIALKVFGDDPYELKVNLDNSLEFGKMGHSFLVGQTCTIGWSATLAWDETGRELVEYWYAHHSDEFSEWE